MSRGKWSLEHWNALVQERVALAKRKFTHPEEFPNSLICPACSGDLYDTAQTFPGFPSRMRVKCQKCPFVGERLEDIK